MTKPQKVLVAAVGGALVFCCVGGGLVWRYSDFGRANAELDQAIVEAKAAGLPWVAGDLAQQPPAPANLNAAPLVVKAVPLTANESKNQKLLVDLAAAQAAFDGARMRTDLARLKPVLDLARRAGDAPRCDFHRDWDQSIWLPFPEYKALKSMAKILAAQAIVEAVDGDTAAACADLRRAFQMGAHAGSDPCLIGLLVAIACDGVALGGVEHVADAWHADQDRLAALAKALDAAPPLADMKTALKGEVYTGVALTRNFPGLKALASFGNSSGNDEEGIPMPKSLVRDGKPATLAGRIFLCRHLQMWTKIWKKYPGKSDGRDICRALDDAEAAEEKAGWSHILNTIMMPVFSQAGEAAVKDAADRGVARGLIAVLRFRARSGRYPASLAEAGFTESDPFTGKPFSLRVVGQSFKVYSVGVDGVDNGGLRKAELPRGAPKKTGFDEVASYPAYRKATK